MFSQATIIALYLVASFSQPPTGYAFLLFKEESSVHKLLVFCFPEGDKFFIYIPLGSLNRKKVGKV